MSQENPAYQKRRNDYLVRTYGITTAQFEAILKKQGGVCPICSRTPETVGSTFHVEHDHKTGEIRGVTCSYCNHRLIGRHRDPELLRRIAKYIEGGTGLFVPKKQKRKTATRRRRKTRV